MLSWLFPPRYSNLHIDTLASKSEARHAAEDAVYSVERRIEALELACAGMWELLQFKLGCTEEELVAAIQTVDARDGKVDGKITKEAGETCPHCHRKLLTKTANRCSWCGASLVRTPF